MRLIIGSLTVLVCVFGGYMALGGNIGVLWQPFEFVIILGAAAGAFIIGNTKPILTGTIGTLGIMLKGPRYSKADFVELLGMQYAMYKLVQSKGVLALE